MYSELSTYIDARITEVNSTISGTDNDLVKIDIDIDSSLLSENQKSNRYMLKIESYEESDTRNGIYNIGLNLELMFVIPNSDTVKYQNIIDNYIHKLITKIRATPRIDTTNVFSFEVEKIRATKLNNFQDSVFSPDLLIEGRVYLAP